MGLLSKDENKVVEIPARRIRPNKTQPRRTFDEEDIRSLSQSISTNGLLQPLTVRKLKNDEYELIAGERRLRASIMAGFQKIPCIVMKCSDKDSAIFALIENLQRKDLSMFEEARGINRLIRKYGITQEQAAIQIGKKQSTVANKLRLLRLSYEEQDWIVQAGLTERHARALLKISDEGLRKDALSHIVGEELNVKESERYIETLLINRPVPQTELTGFTGDKKVVIKDVRIFVNTINKAVDTMRLSGINAISKKQETENYIEYTVKIPKDKALNSSA
ncbi:MAG: ParB/RepB/Spo0J family partition protein [Oscillospiraceae bacterium]|nr:ParB/RepB/Spo0J family partition protein [Oscillospiraceae bacterium]